MAPLGPFGTAPRLAVAVSGGADSLALCLLAAHWARPLGGAVTALTVDHRLREGSSAEARQVGVWLRADGIAHEILIRAGERPRTRVQETARAARFAMLLAWCRAAGVFHVLFGHHRQDQAETLLMRGARGGRSGMTAIVETPAALILRPLLTVEPDRLRAVLIALGQPWIEDPSNRDPRFERVRTRATLEADPSRAEALLSRADDDARSIAEAEGRARRILARFCSVHAAGFARIDVRAVSACSRVVRQRTLSHLLTTVGGQAYPPPTRKLHELSAAIGRQGGLAAATLHGCRIIRQPSGWLVCREARGQPAPQEVVPGGELRWDGRFAIRFAAGASSGRLVALGEPGRLALLAAAPALRTRSVPAVVWPTLPAVVDAEGIREVPHLGYLRVGAAPAVDCAELRPRQPLSFLGSFIAEPESATIY